MKYEAKHYPNRTARVQFVFTLLFSPALLVGIYFFNGDFPEILAYGCVIPVLALATFLTFRLSRLDLPQRWKIDEERIEYSTPTPLFGDSFRVQIAEIEKIILDGDSGFAVCLTRDGNEYRFDISTREGKQFLKHVREITANKSA